MCLENKSSWSRRPGCLLLAAWYIRWCERLPLTHEDRKHLGGWGQKKGRDVKLTSEHSSSAKLVMSRGTDGRWLQDLWVPEKVLGQGAGGMAHLLVFTMKAWRPDLRFPSIHTESWLGGCSELRGHPLSWIRAPSSMWDPDLKSKMEA